MSDRYAGYERLVVRPGADGVCTVVLGPGPETLSVHARLHAELGRIWDDLVRMMEEHCLLGGGGMLKVRP